MPARLWVGVESREGYLDSGETGRHSLKLVTTLSTGNKDTNRSDEAEIQVTT